MAYNIQGKCANIYRTTNNLKLQCEALKASAESGSWSVQNMQAVFAVMAGADAQLGGLFAEMYGADQVEASELFYQTSYGMAETPDFDTAFPTVSAAGSAFKNAVVPILSTVAVTYPLDANESRMISFEAQTDVSWLPALSAFINTLDPFVE